MDMNVLAMLGMLASVVGNRLSVYLIIVLLFFPFSFLVFLLESISLTG